MKKPFLYKKDEPLKLSAQTVFDTVKAIMESGVEEEFIQQCDKEGFSVVVEAKAVNLAKTMLFDRRADKVSTLAANTIKSNRCP